MLYLTGFTWLFSSSEWTPAAFTTAFASKVRPSSVVSFQPSAPFSIFATRASKVKDTPFAAAFSAVRKVRSYGQQMPPVGAHSAATASSLTFGSRARSVAWSRISSPSTPLDRPRSSNF